MGGRPCGCPKPIITTEIEPLRLVGSGEVGGTIPFAGMDNLAPSLVSPSDGPER